MPSLRDERSYARVLSGRNGGLALDGSGLKKHRANFFGSNDTNVRYLGEKHTTSRARHEEDSLGIPIGAIDGVPPIEKAQKDLDDYLNAPRGSRQEAEVVRSQLPDEDRSSNIVGSGFLQRPVVTGKAANLTHDKEQLFLSGKACPAGRSPTPVTHYIDLGDIAKSDEWLKLSAVCTVHDVTNPKILEDFFSGMGFLGCKIAILDRRRVIITFETAEDVKKFLAEEHKWRNDWFTEVCAWSPVDAAQDYFVWIRVERIPLSYWNLDFF